MTHEKVSYRLLEKLKELSIDLIFAEMDRSGFYYPDENAIIINSKLLESNNVNFAIAHELSHVLENHKDYTTLYTSTFSNRRKMEAEANILAIKLLIEVYLEEFDLEYTSLNSISFMEHYGIKKSLLNCVENTMVSYCVSMG